MRNAESMPPLARKADAGTLICPISCRRLGDIKVGKVRGRHWMADATEVTTIKQIRIAIFAKGNYQAGRCCTGHVHQ